MIDFSRMNPKKKRTGLILDGIILVGTFDFYTSEDCIGQRNLENISISLDKIDIESLKSNKPLQYLFVEILDEETYKFKLINNFGFGHISKFESHWCNNDMSCIQNALWKKCSEPKFVNNIFNHAN